MNALLDLYRSMLRIRQVELRIERLYHEDQMKTPIHLCIGQEAIAAGVCAQLRHTDPIFTTYRSHGQYLAKGGDLNAMIAELHCKETGCSKGRGGSMHLIDLSVGHYGSSAIVGGCLPIAAGMALSAQMKGEDRVTAVFFGDGATDEGVYYESVNFAMLKRLPVLFVLEDNEWAVCSHTSARKIGKNLFSAAQPSDLLYMTVDGNDVSAVHDAASTAVDRARQGRGPALLECTTYRIRGHAGSGSDANLGYRSADEIAQWEARCPLRLAEDRLIAAGLLSEVEQAAMKRDIEREIDAAFEFAANSAYPAPETLMNYVYGS
jgi:pyruvate dehydrogenase E1 component alpha subunit